MRVTEVWVATVEAVHITVPEYNRLLVSYTHFSAFGLGLFPGFSTGEDPVRTVQRQGHFVV